MNVYLTKVRSGIALRVFAMRIRAAGALVCALAVLGAAAPASAKPRAVIAFLPAGDSAKPLLDEFAARGMAIGMTSPTVGGFGKRQMALDMGQGTRIPTRLYSGDIDSLRVGGGRLAGWAQTVRRAAGGPGDLVPGLLATTIERAGGHVGFSASGGFSLAAIVACNRSGGVTPRHPGDTLDVVDLPAGSAGLRALDRLLDARTDDELVYVVR